MNVTVGRVLIVDDDRVDAMACRRALARGLHPPPEFDMAPTASQALALARARSYDCVLLDFRLPDMDGLGVLEALLAMPQDVPPPVVMLTGADDVALAVEAMRRGANDYLVKDVHGDYQTPLPAVVERAVRARDLQREKHRADRSLERYRGELQHLAHQLIAQEKAMTRHIAQSLHDRLGQTLAALRLSFDALRAAPSPSSSTAPSNPSSCTDALQDRIVTLIDTAVREVREVLMELRPPLLDESGLLAALDNELRERAPPHREVALALHPAAGLAGRRWPADVEYAAFMVTREAVNNALQHAGGRHVDVRIDGGDDWLHLQVSDDGRGIAEAELVGRPGHLGMVGMRERALAIGARFAVRRNDGREGTCVSLHWGPGP